MTQEQEIVEKLLRPFDFIRRKTKTELSSLPSEGFPIQQYKAPNNSSMSKSETTSKILPLLVLGKTALLPRRVNDNDFHFLKLLESGFKIPKCNGFNTKLAREAGVGLHSATHVNFIPLIIVMRNRKIVWKHGPNFNLKYPGWLYRAYIKTAKNGHLCEELLSENNIEAVLATFCCYDHGAKVFEAVQKIATDQEEYLKCSSCVIIC